MNRHSYIAKRYKAQTALRQHECLVCGGTIEPGEIYLGRKVFRDGTYRGTVRKCGQCVTIKEINGTERA